MENSSHLVISGSFTFPGPALALMISKKCQVNNITLIDPLSPNTPSRRMMVLHRDYRHLKWNIPHLRLLTPSLGMWRKGSNSSDWFGSSPPTHILHFGSQASLRPNEMLETMTVSSYNLFVTGNMVSIVDEFLHLLSHGSNASTRSPRMLHIIQAGGTSFADAMDRNLTSALLRWYTKNFQYNQLEIPVLEMSSETRFGCGLGSETFRPVLQVGEAIVRALAPNEVHTTYTISTSTNPVKTDKASTSPRYNSTCGLDQTGMAVPCQPPMEAHSTLENEADSSFQVENTLSSLFGLEQVRFPCASTCTSFQTKQSRCRSTAWDDIIHATRQASKNCTYVVFRANFSHVLEVPFASSFTQRHPEICRMFFVSASAPALRQFVIKTTKEKHNIPMAPAPIESILSDMNGQINVAGWTMVWLTVDDERLTLSDLSLPLTSPDLLFSDTVKQVMFADLIDFLDSPDFLLLRVFDQMNGRKLKVSTSEDSLDKENSGKKTILFVGETPKELVPQRLLDIVATESSREIPRISAAQATYYDEVSKLLEDEESRPAIELDEDEGMVFPPIWLSVAVLVHDLKSERGRQFRCSWFEEQQFWDSGPQAAEFSLSHLIGRLYVLGELGKPEVNDGETWISFSNKDRSTVVEEDHETVIRILS